MNDKNQEEVEFNTENKMLNLKYFRPENIKIKFDNQNSFIVNLQVFSNVEAIKIVPNFISVPPGSPIIELEVILRDLPANYEKNSRPNLEIILSQENRELFRNSINYQIEEPEIFRAFLEKSTEDDRAKTLDEFHQKLSDIIDNGDIEIHDNENLDDMFAYKLMEYLDYQCQDGKKRQCFTLNSVFKVMLLWLKLYPGKIVTFRYFEDIPSSDTE
ncbi:MAG: hypothetical protein MHPSP_002716, partial [Paramarteilia canceri]